MSTADKLNKLLETKQAIKQAIINKGVEVTDDTKFADYPSKISSIEDRYQEGYDCGSNDGYSNGWSDGWNQGYYEGGNGEGGGDPFYETMWNVITNNNTDYSYLFHSYNGTELDISNLDSGSVTNMTNMFYECKNLITLDLSHFNTSNVTNVSSIFYGCNKLGSIGNISNWDTSNVITMYYMFHSCKSLTSLDLSHFNTSNVTIMNNMFYNCSSLESLDISNFDLTKVSSSYSYMFSSCTSLHTLRLDNCSNDTINKIITSKGFPTNAIDGVTRTIYCKEENAAGLTPPTNWVFSYVTEEVPVDPPAGDIPLYVRGEFLWQFRIN